jgi:hypothetical protein
MIKTKDTEWYRERECIGETRKTEGLVHSSSVQVKGDTKRKQLTEKRSNKEGTIKKRQSKRT